MGTHSCPHCGKSKFYSDEAVHRHRISVHPRKCRMCRLCNLSIWKDFWEEHVATHANCPECREEFRSTSDLYAHILQVHAPVPPPVQAVEASGTVLARISRPAKQTVSPQATVDITSSVTNRDGVERDNLDADEAAHVVEKSSIHSAVQRESDNVVVVSSTALPATFTCEKCQKVDKPVTFVACGHTLLCQSCVMIDLLSSGAVRCFSCSTEVLHISNLA
ncbi:hypothetical protein K474DRAFT_641709 [Panus rudis PR-1116 ss-1]|nr:hypothetical protein K474DRAFT_641709 [Panus rudis PR-1116 ss-1]